MLLLADTGKPGGPARPWAKWKCVLLIQKCTGCKKKKKSGVIYSAFPIILWLGDSLYKFLWKTCGKIYMERMTRTQLRYSKRLTACRHAK